jgi:hypothetical protein
MKRLPVMHFKTDDAGRPISRSTRSPDGPYLAFPIGMGRPVVGAR